MKRTKRSKLSKRKDDVSSAYWKKRADKAWSEAVRLNGHCVIGGPCSGQLEAHHLIPRSNLAHRHDLMNGVPLCSLHHQFSNKLSAHGAPLAFEAWLRDNLSERRAWVSLHHNDILTDKPDYKARYEQLQSVIKARKAAVQ